MKRKLARTVLSLAVAVGAVMAFRWTVRAVMTRAYRAERSVGAPEMPFVPAPRVHSLAALVPEALRVNIAGLAVKRRAERLGIPYGLATDIAEDKAKSAGWERLDDENAMTVRNLSGMERIYRTPEGSVAMRELRPIKGNDTLMEDYIIPAEMIPAPDEHTTPDVLARRSAAHVRGLMPPVVRDVVVGSPLFTQLIERGGGAAFIVRSAAEIPAKGAERAVEDAARRAGWRKNPEPPGKAPSAEMEEARRHGLAASWAKDNLTMHFEALPRMGDGGCDINYRFTDDEVYIQNERKTNEN